MTSYKKLMITFTMAILLLLPLLNRIMETGYLFLLLPLAVLLLEIKGGARGEILDFTSKWDMLLIGILFFLSIVGFVLRLTGVIAANGHRTGEPLVLISVILFYFVLKAQSGWEKSYMQIPVFMGLWILVLYFVDAALFPSFISLFAQGTDTVRYVNMVAFLVSLMAAGLYIYSEEKVMQPVYIAGIILSALVLAVNEAWGTAFLIFVMLVVHSVTIVPVAETMKRLLQVFFGLALLFCNVSLLVNYSGVIHVEGLECRLECGVVGELFLCILALYVFRRWDKIPEGMDLRRIKLSRLQKGCRYFLKGAIRILPFLIVLSLVNGKLEPGNIVQLFVGERWEEWSTDVFVVAMLSLLSHMYQALEEMWTGNLFAVFYQLYGWIGAVVSVGCMGLLCYRVYYAVWKEGTVDALLAWITVGAVSALVFLPVTVYMLPVYLLFTFLAVNVKRTVEMYTKEC